MSIWIRISEALAALASGEGLAAVFDRLLNAPNAERSVGFTIGVIALSAKMAKADGQVTRDEVATFRQIFQIDPTEVIDGVIIWWRDGDGDLIDELMDALTFLSETGPIWVMTPKMGRANYVEASEIQDAAPTAGLSVTSSIAVATDWTATRLVARKAGKR